MNTNDVVMQTFERIALDLRGLREDAKAQSERGDLQSQRLAAQGERTGRPSR